VNGFTATISDGRFKSLHGDYRRASQRWAIFVCAFKSLLGIAVNRYLRRAGQPLWQRTYGDRVIRDEDELLRIRQYIAQNPLH
jgi:hypothetical protein